MRLCFPVREVCSDPGQSAPFCALASSYTGTRWVLAWKIQRGKGLNQKGTSKGDNDMPHTVRGTVLHDEAKWSADAQEDPETPSACE